MSNEEAEVSSAAAERLNAAIDRLLAERRPPDPTAGTDEAELWQVAALLKQARPDLAAPRPAYLAALGQRLRAAGDPSRGRVSRRQALSTGATALAAGAAGFAIGRLTEPASTSSSTSPPARLPSRELTLRQGEWVPVAHVSDVPPGAVVPFAAGAVLGHLVNREGHLVALSAICTHMGCVLRWNDDTQLFNCPCHNADFNSEGVIQPTPDYPWTPPPLPVLQVKVEDDQVWVLGTGDPPPILRHHDHPPA